MIAWHKKQWAQLSRLQAEKRLPHALLFTGPQGIGKTELALKFAQLILCQNPQTGSQQLNSLQSCDGDSACQSCHSCHLLLANSHPDFYHIQPEQEGSAIKIDQIRDLSEFIQKTSHQGGYRVVLIQPAAALNTYAANALLKTLEEPTPNTLIILLSDQRSTLTPTITSRCQRLRFSAPSQEEALAWLQAKDSSVDWPALLEATEGAPFQALAWQEQGIWPKYQSFMADLAALGCHSKDPLQVAVQWKETKLLWVFDLFFQWLLKLMWIELKGELKPTSLALEQKVSAEQLLDFVEYLQRLRAEALGAYNLNQQLVLESLFIRWAQYAAR